VSTRTKPLRTADAAVLLIVALIGAFVFAWGLSLVLTADQDEEGARGFFGWIILLADGAIAGLSLGTFLALRHRAKGR
jgi:hypothetical protein